MSESDEGSDKCSQYSDLLTQIFINRNRRFSDRITITRHIILWGQALSAMMFYMI